MFSNPTIQSTITTLNGNKFSWLVGFGMYSSSNTTYYYVMDNRSCKVYILNDEWSFISFTLYSPGSGFFQFDRPNDMITIGNSLYLIGDSNIYQLDKNLNILKKYQSVRDTRYRGISYNPKNGLKYAAAYGLKEIQVFNVNLNLVRHLSTSPYGPYSITEYADKFYIGTDEGLIIVLNPLNGVIAITFNGCNGDNDFSTSILFDQYGYMAISCFSRAFFSSVSHAKLCLHYPNGSFTGKILTTPEYPNYIGFDSKGRFIQISSQQITIYN